jgi:rhodanese-related sulfurtransferase
MNSISPKDLKELLDKGQDIQIIDVREEFEFEACNIGGKLIPMGEVINKTEEIRKDGMVVVHCKAGTRSKAIINLLETQFKYENLYNLDGGIFKWIDEVDDTLTKY